MKTELTDEEKRQVAAMRGVGIRRKHIADKLCLDFLLVVEYCDALSEYDAPHRAVDPTPEQIAKAAAEIKQRNLAKFREIGCRNYYDRMPRHYCEVPTEIK